jgi:hypothetical protein
MKLHFGRALIPLSALLGLALTGCLPSGTTGAPCNVDSDCDEGTICLEGTCQTGVIKEVGVIRDAGENGSGPTPDAGPAADAGASPDAGAPWDGGEDADSGDGTVDAGPASPDGGNPQTDGGGMTSVDGGNGALDSGNPGDADAATPIQDAALPPADAGPPAEDAGGAQGPGDAGDAGDAGGIAPDAGPMTQDSGSTSPDAGPPPPDPVFYLSELAEGSATTTDSQTVAVVVLSGLSDFYFLSETQDTPPDPAAPGWNAGTPGNFQLSAGAGEKTVYLWVMDAAGQINGGPIKATITLVNNIIRVGGTALGCPADTGGACDIWPSQGLNPLQRAEDLTAAGDAIWIYDGPFDSPQAYVGEVDIDASIVFEGAPGSQPENVRVEFDSGGTNNQGTGNRSVVALVRLLANNITLRGLTFWGRYGMATAVSANLGMDADDYTAGLTISHLIERNIFHAARAPFRGANSIEDAVEPGAGSVVRNNFFHGYWEGVLRVDTEGNGLLPNVVFVHNTAVVAEDGPVLLVDEASNVLVKNNIFITFNRHPSTHAINGEVGKTSGTIEDNVFYSWAMLGDNAFPVGSNFTTAPFLVDMKTPTLASDSSFVDVGDVLDEAGMWDLHGNLRIVNNAADLGAVEGPSADAALSQTITVGATTNGCGGACTFAGPVAFQDAIEKASPGSTIEIFAGSYISNGVVIDRELDIFRSGGAALGDVVVYNSANVLDSMGMLKATLAENIRISGLTFEMDNGAEYALLADPGATENPDNKNATQNILFENNEIYTVSSDGSDIECSVYPGAYGIVRNNLAHGNFECFARLKAQGVEVRNNTFVSTEPGTSFTGLEMGGANNITIANNLFDLSGATGTTTMASYGPNNGDMNLAWHELPQSAPINITWSKNQFFGIDDEAGDFQVPLGDASGNCVGRLGGSPQERCPEPNPTFVNAGGDNFHLDTGSPAIDYGDNSGVGNGELDLDGNARIGNGTVDVGCYESN